MANHGYVTTKKNLTPDKLGQILDEINQRRFNGLVFIERREDDTFEIGVEKKNLPDGTDYLRSATCWLASKRKIEFRHSLYGDFHSWIWFTFIEEVALALDGLISDQAYPGKLKPKPNWCPTYWEWQTKNLKHYDHLTKSAMLKIIEDKKQEHCLYKDRFPRFAEFFDAGIV